MREHCPTIMANGWFELPASPHSSPADTSNTLPCRPRTRVYLGLPQAPDARAHRQSPTCDTSLRGKLVAYDASITYCLISDNLRFGSFPGQIVNNLKSHPDRIVHIQIRYRKVIRSSDLNQIVIWICPSLVRKPCKYTGF